MDHTACKYRFQALNFHSVLNSWLNDWMIKQSSNTKKGANARFGVSFKHDLWLLCARIQSPYFMWSTVFVEIVMKLHFGSTPPPPNFTSSGEMLQRCTQLAHRSKTEEWSVQTLKITAVHAVLMCVMLCWSLCHFTTDFRAAAPSKAIATTPRFGSMFCF
jgi:hypothetical protein